MIINIDHIAYSAVDIKTEIQNFIQKGYNLEFCETLPNLKIKEQFLTKYNKTHELALLKSKNGYNIEILNHGEISEEEGFINFISENRIEIKTEDIEASKKFFAYFSFKNQSSNEMSFSSFFDKEKSLFVEFKEDKSTEHKLNDKGYNCIAFITTSVEKDIENLKECGCNISQIAELKVNSKPMKIAFVQRGNNEIAELIEVIR